MNFVGLITACLEKSFTTCQSFKKVLELIDKLTKSCSKYHDYRIKFYSSEWISILRGPQPYKTAVELPYLDGPLDGKSKNWRELLVIETVEEKLGTLDFYNPACLDKIFPKGKLKHLKKVVVL